jgi:hypoxanthine phosphoribosyltransferase
VTHAVPPADPDKIFITAEGLLRDSFALAMQILDSGFQPTVLVALWRGGAPIGIAVQEFLEHHGVTTDHVAIRTSSYTGIDRHDKTVRVHGIDYLVSRLSFDDRLLLIDDVFDSGRSLDAVIDELARRCKRNLPEALKIATVYHKPERNCSRREPDFHVHRTDRWLVFPHELQGLSEAEIRRHKPWALAAGGGRQPRPPGE